MDRKTRLEQLRAVLEAQGCGDLMAAILDDLRREATPPPPPPAPTPEPPPAHGGRPSAITDKLAARIATYIRAGGTPRAAAVAAGVPAQTFDEWMRRGNGRHRRPRTKRFARFAEAIHAAAAEVRIACEIEVRRSAPLAWLRAAAKDVWVEQSHVTVTPGEPLEVRVIYVDHDPDPAASAAALSTGNGHKAGAKV